MRVVKQHRGVIIFYHDGGYHPSTDLNIEGGSIRAIEDYIDRCFFKHGCAHINDYILYQFKQRKNILN